MILKFIRHNDSIQSYIKSRYRPKVKKKKINVRENTKQNYVNGVDFLQYYKNN